MIRLRVHNEKNQSFVVDSDEPITISSMTIEGKTILYVYPGVLEENDQETEPLFCYDGNNYKNVDVTYDGANLHQPNM